LKGQLAKEPQQYFNFITSSVVRMSKLTAGMVTYLKLGKNDQKMQPVDLNVILKQVLTSKQAGIQQKSAIIPLASLLIFQRKTV